MEYVCKECGRKISRGELEEASGIRCPDCGSYKIRKLESEE